MKVFRRSLPLFAAVALAAILLDPSPGPWPRVAGNIAVQPAHAQAGSGPRADAGFDQTVAVNATVVLDASGSNNPEGNELSFDWSFESAPASSGAVIFDPTEVKPTFVVDGEGDYVVRLIVTDELGNSAVDTVIVNTGNVAPVADAGPDQTVSVKDEVYLDASGSSDVNGDTLNFIWEITSKPSGSEATLDTTALRPSFTADLPGEYMVSLVADDLKLPSAADEVRISTFDSYPVTEAGPDQKVAVGQTVLARLEGLFDADGELIEERDWSIIARPIDSNADFLAGKNRRFVIDEPGTYVVQRLICEEVGGDDDDDGDIGNGGSCSDFDTLILTTDANIRPVADAGPDQNVMEPPSAGTTVALRGAGSSDLDGDRLTYRWALTTVPAGSTAELDDATAVNPSFQADRSGTYVAQLIVREDREDMAEEESRPDTVVITTGNSRPLADAGPDQKERKKSTIELDGSGSLDVDGVPPTYGLTYDWSLVKRPSKSRATLKNPDRVDPTFFTDTGKRFVAQLIVHDGTLASAPDNVVVGPGNMRPVAEAGDDQENVPLGKVQLDGSDSFDAGDDPPTYQWALTATPEGSGATLTGANTAKPSFTADVPGVYVAQLIVMDNDAAPLVSDPDTVAITVNN